MKGQLVVRAIEDPPTHSVPLRLSALDETAEGHLIEGE